MTIFARLILVVFTAIAFMACGAEQRWNVLLVTLDTTRADHLGSYGHPTAQTPTMDRLAADGALFEHCISAVPITTPSHSTIFTGAYPLAHGVRDNGLFVLPEEALTLAEILHAEGWATGAAVGAFPVTRRFKLDQGFEYFDDHITLADEDMSGQRTIERQSVFFDERPAPWVNDAILPWLDSNLDNPFFAWVHYWDAHHPHAPPPPFDEIFAHDLYLGEISYVDQALASLLARLEDAGVADRTLVIVVGDHGEGLGEHNEQTHSLLTYDTTLRVPFILRVPGREGGLRITQRVGTVDVLPTVLELLNLPIPPSVQGRSLLPLLDGQTDDEGHTYYAETLSPRLSYGWGELRALYRGRHKYIHGPRQEMFDLDDDPSELNNLIDADVDLVSTLRSELQSFISSHSSSSAADAAVVPDEETRRRLAALGYVSLDGDDPGDIEETLTSDGTAPQDRVSDINLMSTAKQLLHRGNYLASRETAQSLVERDPNNAYYRSLLALSLLGLGQLEDAARLADGTGVTDTRSSEVFLQVAAALFSSGSTDRAVKMAGRINGENSTPNGHYLLGEMYSALGQQERCLREFSSALDEDSKFYKARLSIAITYARMGDLAAAENEFLKLMKDQPLDPKARLNYSIFLLRQARWDEALTSLDRALELSPTYWRAHLARLAAYVDFDRVEEAEISRERIRQRCSDPRVQQRADALMELL
ncbi:MAG: sulfatase-like hydrolase/transferase [bacterium]|nr:sulfatase-like hydrolase/transferase [bacterium]